MTTPIRTTGKSMLAAVSAAGTLLALAGCDTASSAPPTTVLVNTPPSDGGMAVLITVVIVLAVLALLGAAGFACAWTHERRSRREAENTVYALTGHHPTRIAVTASPDLARVLALEPDRTPTERHTR